MLRILHGTNFDFIRLQKITTIFTTLLIVPGLLLIAIVGFNYSIEFTGGTLIQVRFAQPVEAGEIRTALRGVGIEGTEIQRFGSDQEYVIRAQEREQVEAQATAGAETVAETITTTLRGTFGADRVTIVRTEAVGPKVGGELRARAGLAMLLAFVVVLFYLAWRFEWRFGVAAVIATAHDFLATMAFAKYMDLEISLVVVGAVLTVIGYSLNDTIVIFDRIRENLKLDRRSSLYDLINRSINETLPRTVMTGVTTTGTILALLIFAGPVIRPFAWILLFGIIVGTFSSIYVASPILLVIERKWPHRIGEKSTVRHRDLDREAPARPRSKGEVVAR